MTNLAISQRQKEVLYFMRPGAEHGFAVLCEQAPELLQEGLITAAGAAAYRLTSRGEAARQDLLGEVRTRLERLARERRGGTPHA